MALPPTEEARVFRLIAQVEASDGAVFLRNGRQYSAQNAAMFLRRKCASRLAGYATAEEFVAQCAARSSTSGEAYRIRFAGEQEAQPSAEVLGRWLGRIAP